MPRLSLWRDKKSNDYRFIDRTISEMFTVGATDLYVHKYIGTNNPTNSQDLTLPHYPDDAVTNIQDLLFLENRDRKYDPNIYRLRGHYNVQNLDFDLSQFGLFLTNDIIFVTVHYNDMIDVIGRKLMVGDVFELPHLTDYHPLNETIPIGLRRYYQITDANFASEGFSQTWYPHLWRIKCEPLVDSQEFNDILKQPISKDNYLGDWDPSKTYEPGYTVAYGDKIYTPIISVPAGINPPNPTYWQLSTGDSLKDIIGRYNKNIEINDANIAEAARLVPKSGYDRHQLYVLPTYLNDEPSPPVNVITEVNVTFSYSFKLEKIINPLYRTPGIVMRIPKNSPAISGLKLKAGNSAILESGVTKTLLTDSGSGPVSGDPVLITSFLGLDGVNGPYGTADNTYAFADQYINFFVTALQTEPQTTVIPLLEVPSELVPGLKIRTTIFSENGTPTKIFSNNTTVVSVNIEDKTMTVSSPTRGSIPAGAPIELAYNFNGTITSEMNYRADCDPRFAYIRRYTPRGFGYITGYLSGNQEAPNGEPVGSGTSFPNNPRLGDYFLRLDYLPQKLFRWDGKRWIEISRNVRTVPSLGSDDQSQISTFINNNGTVQTSEGTTIPSRQSLSQALKIQVD